jgi:Coenzyme PQQ synthesis protein D (PqqD)
MLAISNTVRRTRTPDGGILLDTERGQILCLNVIGFQILELIEEGFDERQIVGRLCVAYNANVATVRTDVHEFLDALNRHEVLQRQPPAARSEPETSDGNTDAT